MPTDKQWNEAREFTRANLREGDAEKWAEYLAARASSYEAGRDWILAQGYAEFIRLQQLNFWRFI